MNAPVVQEEVVPDLPGPAQWYSLFGVKEQEALTQRQSDPGCLLVKQIDAMCFGNRLDLIGFDVRLGGEISPAFYRLNHLTKNGLGTTTLHGDVSAAALKSSKENSSRLHPSLPLLTRTVFQASHELRAYCRAGGGFSKTHPRATRLHAGRAHVPRLGGDAEELGRLQRLAGDVLQATHAAGGLRA
jgi:hypothetical protein